MKSTNHGVQQSDRATFMQLIAGTVINCIENGKDAVVLCGTEIGAPTPHELAEETFNMYTTANGYQPVKDLTGLALWDIRTCNIGQFVSTADVNFDQFNSQTRLLHHKVRLAIITTTENDDQQKISEFLSVMGKHCASISYLSYSPVIKQFEKKRRIFSSR